MPARVLFLSEPVCARRLVLVALSLSSCNVDPRAFREERLATCSYELPEEWGSWLPRIARARLRCTSPCGSGSAASAAIPSRNGSTTRTRRCRPSWPTPPPHNRGEGFRIRNADLTRCSSAPLRGNCQSWPLSIFSLPPMSTNETRSEFVTKRWNLRLSMAWRYASSGSTSFALMTSSSA